MSVGPPRHRRRWEELEGSGRDPDCSSGPRSFFNSSTTTSVSGSPLRMVLRRRWGRVPQFGSLFDPVLLSLEVRLFISL